MSQQCYKRSCLYLLLFIIILSCGACASRSYVYGFELTSPGKLKKEESVVQVIAYTDIILPLGYALSPIFFISGVMSGTFSPEEPREKEQEEFENEFDDRGSNGGNRSIIKEAG